ncbi:unnamed protein product, partial [Dovyalis caffra]
MDISGRLIDDSIINAISSLMINGLMKKAKNEVIGSFRGRKALGPSGAYRIGLLGGLTSSHYLGS